MVRKTVVKCCTVSPVARDGCSVVWRETTSMRGELRNSFSPFTVEEVEPTFYIIITLNSVTPLLLGMLLTDVLIAVSKPQGRFINRVILDRDHKLTALARLCVAH